MPQRDDEFDDDRPRRRPRDDDDDRSRRRRDDDDEDDRPPRKKSNTGLIVGILVGVFVLCCGGGGTVVYIIVQRVKKGVEQVTEVVQAAAEAEESRPNLLRIGKAAQDHHDTFGVFPTNTCAGQGRQVQPLLSWRVHLLPFLGEEALFKQFKLNEPWDSPSNIQLLNRMPAVYTTPSAKKRAGEGKTYYRGFSDPGGMFEMGVPNQPHPGVRIAGIPDGLSITLLVVEAGESVEWTKPEALDFSPGKPRPALGGPHANFPYFLALTCDGVVHQARKDMSDVTLRMLIDRKDGRAVPADWEVK